ncbi:Ig-like domain-containing protein, partial [Acinetobacter guillouiae]|uniref:Ig-like domain-containing protein n=1 Tax=Acinetobacter guillouiae TaxID=106649 RepID=UPI003AF5D7F2
PTSVQSVGSTDGKTLVVNGEGTWTVDPFTGNITFTPEASFKGDPTPISYTVKDCTGLVSNPATVTIDYPQDKPVASNDTQPGT